jgi:hypothetical protein
LAADEPTGNLDSKTAKSVFDSSSEGDGGEQTGNIVYTVIIEPQGWDERLRWNMTASVVIEPKS